MTDAEKKWRELGHGARIDELKKILNDPVLGRPYKARTLQPNELQTFADCQRLAVQEGLCNWFNYWPERNGLTRTPDQCIADVIVGKQNELLAALNDKNNLAEYPTVFQLKSREEYDYKLKIHGRVYKCDCKSSSKMAFEHVEEQSGVIAVYPEFEGTDCSFCYVPCDDESKLRLYLDGKLDLSMEDLQQIKLGVEEDIACRPESKYWASHGYKSREDWYKANGPDLEEYDKSIDVRQALLAEIEKKLGLKIQPAKYPN